MPPGAPLLTGRSVGRPVFEATRLTRLCAFGAASPSLQILRVLHRLLEWMGRHEGELLAILDVPFLVFFSSFGSISLARSVLRRIVELHLVHVMVVRAPLNEDVLIPRAEFPFSSFSVARPEVRVAILGVRDGHSGCRAAHDLKVVEGAVLGVLAILGVHAARRGIRALWSRRLPAGGPLSSPHPPRQRW